MTIAVNCEHTFAKHFHADRNALRFTVMVSFHQDIGCPSFTDWVRKTTGVPKKPTSGGFWIAMLRRHIRNGG